MGGIVLGHQAGQGGKIQAFGFDLVQQPRQLGGQADGLVLVDRGEAAVRRQSAAVSLDAGGQQKLALQGGHGRRQGRAAPAQALGAAVEQQLLRVAVAPGQHARQQQGAPAGAAQESRL